MSIAMDNLESAVRGWRWPALATVAAAAMLAAAHGFERIGGLAPCELCLRQRDVYWAALAMAVTGLALLAIRPQRRFLVALNIMLGLVFLTGAIVAGYHAGVEWGFWPGPAGCSGAADGAAVAAMDLGSGLDQRFAVASCGEAAARLLGLSMAGWNALAALVFAVLSFFAAREPKALHGWS